MIDRDSFENELAIQDRVLVEAQIDDRSVPFRTVIVRICPTELWLGVASSDRRLDTMAPNQGIKLTIARDGAALLAWSDFIRPLGDSRSRVFAVARPAVLERVQRRATSATRLTCLYCSGTSIPQPGSLSAESPPRSRGT